MKKRGRNIRSYFKKTNLLILTLLFLLALLPRLYKLGETPLYPDEITWMVRAKETALALRTLNLDYFSDAWWNIKGDTESIAIPLTVSVGFPIIYLGKGQSILSYNLLQDYIAGRMIVITVSSIFIVVYYLFAQKYFNKKVALLSAILLSLDPIFLANSKLIMNDMFLTFFVFFSISSYVLIKNERLSIFLASLGSAGAFLTKPQGILVLPVFFLQIFIKHKKKKRELKKFIITLLLFLIFVSLFWPASWSNPIFAIPEYLLRQKALITGGINNYFLGNITNNPPFYYYLFQLLTRLPPLIILGFIFYPFAFTKDKSKIKSSLTIILFIFIFLGVVSFSPKKLGARYILPLWPWIYLFAGKTILFFTNKIKYSFFRIVILASVIIYSLILAIYYFPYHDLYYNVFIGGTVKAQKYDLVGLCSGSKAAVNLISRCYPSVRDIAVLGCGSSTIAYYYPYPVNNDWRKENVLIIENHYLQLEKDKEVLEFYNNNKPTHTINIKGAEMAHIYIRNGVENKCD